MKKVVFSFFLFFLFHFVVFAQQVRLILPIGHSQRINTAVYSPDGDFIATASMDNTVKIWESNTGRLFQTLEGNAYLFWTAEYSPACPTDPNGGEYILTSSMDNTAKVWESSTGNLLLTMDGHTDEVRTAVYSADGNFILTASWDSTAKIWESNTGKLLITLDGHKAGVESAAFSPNGKFVLTTSDDSTAKVWESSTGNLLQTIPAFSGEFKTAVFSPACPNDPSGGKYILTASMNNAAQIWERQTGNHLHSLTGHASEISMAAYSPDGKMIVTTSRDSTAKIWESSTGKLLHTLVGHTGLIRTASFSPVCQDDPTGGKFIITASSDKSCKLWESNSGKLLDTFFGHESYVNWAVFSPNGKNILTASGDYTAKTWNRSDGRLLHTLDGHTAEIQRAVYSPACVNDPCGGKFILTTSWSKTAKIWEGSTGKLRCVLEGHTAFIFSAVFSRDGKYILTASGDSTAKIWESETGKLLINLTGHTGKLTTANFSPDGNFVITTSRDRSAIIWESKTGKIIHTLTGHKNETNTAEFSPICAEDTLGGKFVLTSSKDKTAKLWETSSGLLLYTLGEHKKGVSKASFSSDGKLILTVSLDSTTKIWDRKTGSLLQILRSPKSPAIGSVFSPDGKFVLSISNDTMINIWEASTGRLLQILEGHSDEIKSAVFSPICLTDSIGGKYVLAASCDKTAKIWECKTGTLVNTLKGHTSWVLSANYSPNGKYIVTTSWDKTMKIWDVNTYNEVASIIAIDNYDWVVTNSSGISEGTQKNNYNYYCSRNALKTMTWSIGLKIFNFEQFDLQYNRPDLVLERIGIADTSLINAYRKAYYKRLKRMRVDEGMFCPDFHMPEIAVLMAEQIPQISEKEKQAINIKATDTKYKLDRLNIWINDVPIYGTNGIDLRARQTDSIEKEITLDLAQGENKIQVSCLNEKGVESLKESVWITYDPKKPVVPKRYLCAISVSKYKDVQYNLKYAVKDGRDMSALFADKNAIIDTLFNQNATRENILALKQKLMQTGVDDEVILYVSGHGLLDENYDFYFATYDMNFGKPAERGILYDDLEGLLDGIPARKKLLLMDACHSGEVDKDEIEVKDTTMALADGKKGDIKTYGYKGTEVDALNNGKQLGLQNSFELMQELFANLTRGSGAVVISAAAGTGYALESPEWNNGVFTYCILNGLKNLAADTNGDKSVTVTELKDYVSNEVERLTNGAQKPTSRRESLEFDWQIWR